MDPAPSSLPHPQQLSCTTKEQSSLSTQQDQASSRRMSREGRVTSGPSGARSVCSLQTPQPPRSSPEQLWDSRQSRRAQWSESFTPSQQQSAIAASGPGLKLEPEIRGFSAEVGTRRSRSTAMTEASHLSQHNVLPPNPSGRTFQYRFPPFLCASKHPRRCPSPGTAPVSTSPPPPQPCAFLARLPHAPHLPDGAWYSRATSVIPCEGEGEQMPETPQNTRVSTDVVVQAREPSSHLYSTRFGNGDAGKYSPEHLPGQAVAFLS